MQFIPNGPDFPDALLRALEDGRLVFFCGAGISYPAALPGFRGLVDAIYERLGTRRTDIEEKAYQLYKFDATLDLLERRFPGQRLAVRRALAAVLQPDLSRKGATDTHAALIQLARCRDGGLRLVTTNFDRIFAHVTAAMEPPVAAYPAPLLPIPKSSRWNGLVYLHGLLPSDLDDSALNRLVVTSGDFGLAYLTERWAARFVSELFRNYVVCFVGYSINDPVLRYMMDALAADRTQGEITPQAYALGECSPGQEAAQLVEWEAKGVVPILYEVPAESQDHSSLHRSLQAWAAIYRDGILGRERIVVDYALARPSASTQQDDFVGRMLWALSHASGLPAKRFAEHEPAPPLDWLEAFAEKRFRCSDLARFGIPSRESANDTVSFSLIRRPAPYDHAPWMGLASGGTNDGHWDGVMLHLARWLTRYLDDPALILWLAECGGQLHNRFVMLIENEIEKFAKFERAGNTDELARIRERSPSAIPRPILRPVWRLLLTGRIKSPSADHLDLHYWKHRLQRDGLTATLRLQLRELLAPKVSLRKPFRWWGSEKETEDSDNLKRYVDCGTCQ